MKGEPLSKSGSMELGDSEQSLENGQRVYVDSSKAALTIEDFGDDEIQPKIDDGRDQWGSKVQFFLTVVAYAVGLGNVWRFPYLCQQNGGGAFLIPYFIMLFLEGIPLFLLELGIGQKMRLGSISVWNKIHPMLGGIGIASAMAAYLVGIYYIVIISWCFYYLFMSFRLTLPWEKELCPGVNFTNETEFHHSLRSLPPISNSTPANATLQCLNNPTTYYWYMDTLNLTESINDTGGINWKLFGCFVLSWTLIFFTVFKGIKSSGKVIYFTALFPYVVLIIFFFRGITLPGAFLGLQHLFTPQFDKLWDPMVWLQAATQIFYSFGLGFGSLISFGSYNDPNCDVKRDVLAVSTVNGFTAISSAVVVFTILGFMSQDQYNRCIYNKIHFAATHTDLDIFAWQANHTIDNMPQTMHYTYEELRDNFWMHDIGNGTVVNVTDVVGMEDFGTCDLKKTLTDGVKGTGLTFILFTEAISKMPGGPIFAFLFFMKLLTLGIGSMIGDLEGVITPIDDLKLVKWMKKYHVSGMVCLVSFISGIIFVTEGGEYFLKLFDDWAGTFSLTGVALAEMVAIGWIYGADRFADDIEKMTGRHIGWYWKISWKFIGPILVGGLIVASLFKMVTEGVMYEVFNRTTMEKKETPYPGWAIFVVYLVIALGALPIPAVALMRKLGFRKLELAVSEANAAIGTTMSTAKILQSQDDLDDLAGAEDFENQWNKR